MMRSSRLTLLFVPLGLIVLAGAPMMLNRYWLFLVTTLFAYVIALVGLKVLFGDAGQLSLGQAAFVGIGAYTAAIVTDTLALTLPYEILVVALVSALIAAVIAIPALREIGRAHV